MEVIKRIKEAETIWEILPLLTVAELEAAIQVSSDSYHNSSLSLITDDEYDLLIEKLRVLNPKSIIFDKIGAPVKGNKTKLPYWMGSMEKIKDDVALQKWLKEYKGPYIISDKLDGISCLLVCKGGKLSMFTRGNGEQGQNISHLIDLVDIDLAVVMEKKINFAVRGELIMSKKKFKKYAKNKANARNTVGGIVNSKPTSVDKSEAADVDFVAYEVIEPQLSPTEQFDFLEENEFNTVYYKRFNKIDLNVIEKYLKTRKEVAPYEIDGIIVTDDNNHPRNKTGNPKYSFAFKGKTETAVVEVTRIVWNPSKDGYLVPKIYLTKTKLSGVMIERTAGFNARFIKQNKIGPGAKILLIRSGDTIPHVLSVVEPAKKSGFPKVLNYKWNETKVNIILNDIENNSDVIIKRLTKFMKDIEVDNLSEGIVTKLVNGGYDTIPKIIVMTVDDFLELDGFQEKLANKLYNNLKKAMDEITVLKLMGASNLFGRGFGFTKLEKILNKYPNVVETYAKKDKNDWHDSLLELEGFSDKSVDLFLEKIPYFQQFYKTISKITPIQPHVVVEVEENSGGIFEGEVVVFTGFRDKTWEDYIVKEGGRMGSKVSGSTTLLVYADGKTESNSYVTAKKLNIKTVPRSDFVRQYGI